MMSHKTSIRIVKHGGRQGESSLTGTPHQDANALHRGAREVAGNVSDWVREFRERRPADPRKAFARLFVESPSSSLNPLR